MPDNPIAFDEDQLKRISTRVRKAISKRFGVRGATFLFNHIDIVTVILRETYSAIRVEIEGAKKD